MDLDDLQKPNIGTPEFASGRSRSERKLWAIVTTIAFAVFWFAGLFTAAGLYGQQDLGFNCQLVQVNGDTMRFTSDQGTGQFADLTLR